MFAIAKISKERVKQFTKKTIKVDLVFRCFDPDNQWRVYIRNKGVVTNFSITQGMSWDSYEAAVSYLTKKGWRQ